MRYNRYLYRLPVQAVPITDIVKNSISSADIVTDPIIGISLKNTIYVPLSHSQTSPFLIFCTGALSLAVIAPCTKGTYVYYKR